VPEHHDMPQDASVIRLAPNYCPPVNDGAEPLFATHAEKFGLDRRKPYHLRVRILEVH